MDQYKKRNSSIELLRIVSIFLIVLGHACRHGVIDNSNLNMQNLSRFSNVMVYIFSAGGGIANRIFILITGYFSIKSKGFMVEKVSNLFVTDHLYSAIICIALCFGGIHVSAEMVIESAFPIWFGLNWFITCFLLLLLLIPFLNIIINNMSNKDLMKLIIIIFVVRYLAGSLFAKTFMNVGNTLEEFVVMYLIGSMLSKCRQLSDKLEVFYIILCIGTVGLILSDTFLYYVQIKSVWLSRKLGVTHFHDLFEVIIAIGAFGIAVNKTFYSNTINILARCTLGTYLIHDNPLLRDIIWNNAKITRLLDENCNTFIAIILVYAISIVVSCFIIDGIIQRLLKKPIRKASLIIEQTIRKFQRKLSEYIVL